MSSILLSLAGGIGIYVIFDALASPPSPARSGHAGWRVRSSEWLRQAGLLGVSPGQFAAVAFAGAAVVGFVVLGFSRSWAVAGAFSLLGGYLPVSAFRTRRRRRQHELRGVWPDAIDNLASGLRAGLSLAEAVGGLAERGPDILRPPFARFAAAYRAGGRFSEALDGLKDELADPVADRVIETLRLAREVGGSELGRLLRTLSAFLREELRVRRELEARQSWTVTAARVALAAPWVVLLLMATRPEAVAAYDSVNGLIVLGVGGLITLVGYRMMLRIARLPREERVLR